MKTHDDGIGAHDGRTTAGLVGLVSDLWCEVLELPEVSPSDNFFDLGGHSLLLHTVRDRLAEHLGRDVPLVDLFQHPTVGDLADHLTSGTSSGVGSDAAPGGRLARLEARRAGRGARSRTARGGAQDVADVEDVEDEAW
ncbi:phosphopantetheine-binding protein [Streptomyces sp. NPDC041068]|uniref:phosphopantetheine-binding protein n=1 Tax=Streptomyces sp. NPDC041068 TaxID=3155130 RepID=UPI00340654DE